MVRASVVVAALVVGDTKALVAASTVVAFTVLLVWDVLESIVVDNADDIAALVGDFTLVVGKLLIGKPVAPATVVGGDADDGEVLSLVDLNAEIVDDVVICSPVVRASVVIAMVFVGDTKAFVNVTTVGFG